MGYQGVEFYAPYFEWSESETKQMRKLLNELDIPCFSTHNDSSYLSPEKIGRARDMNLILGSKYVVMASSDPEPGLDGWKAVADALNAAADQLESSGLKVGYHNHQRLRLAARKEGLTWHEFLYTFTAWADHTSNQRSARRKSCATGLPMQSIELSARLRSERA
jgi:sugar phosphate isomerase/epimerase